jgi:hypothetical protein
MSYNLVNPTTGALTRVSGNISSNIIPSNASASNKLVAKSDTAIKHNYSMVGTASLEDDIKTFVTALIALGTNTYVGFFNRSGNLGSAGNYCITVYAEEGTSTFASGYIVLGAGAMGKAQYEMSYYKPTGSSVEWKIEKLVTKSDIVDTVADGDMHPVTSNAVYDVLKDRLNGMNMAITTSNGTDFSTRIRLKSKSYVSIYMLGDQGIYILGIGADISNLTVNTLLGSNPPVSPTLTSNPDGSYQLVYTYATGVYSRQLIIS